MTKDTQTGADSPSEKAKAGAQNADPKAAAKASDPEAQKRAKTHADKTTNENG